MPILYSLDLQWRIIWISLAWHASLQDIGQQLSVSERTVRRYLKMFKDMQDVQLAEGTVNGEKFEDFVINTLIPI